MSMLGSKYDITLAYPRLFQRFQKRLLRLLSISSLLIVHRYIGVHMKGLFWFGWFGLAVQRKNGAEQCHKTLFQEKPSHPRLVTYPATAISTEEPHM